MVSLLFLDFIVFITLHKDSVRWCHYYFWNHFTASTLVECALKEYYPHLHIRNGCIFGHKFKHIFLHQNVRPISYVDVLFISCISLFVEEDNVLNDLFAYRFIIVFKLIWIHMRSRLLEMNANGTLLITKL